MAKKSEKSVKLPTFDGAPKNFQIWWMRFVAYVMVYKFNKAIEKNALDPDMPQSQVEVLDETSKVHQGVQKPTWHYGKYEVCS